MHTNPTNWRIEQIQTVAKEFNIEVRNTKGSHVVLTHDLLEMALCIPAHRPIKAIYIKNFLKMINDIEDIT